ncbi:MULTISPECIES: Crp/Fnr family transcriptional regulator [Chloracidobacterium]|jgi:CRP/FNR family cyclic AMP-dependent transcriptional regulator|uniref:Crp/Fnr family transcriptional regulator n=1 Tax=Chloracidobacterium sp. N TaxID=2821540 RepID=A0ABX8B207_9BACT|nr:MULTISPECIES: Crp/Fnr family transcriptional regulator [Chloracidobacterium]QUV85042.1 Crp/Fnr family transcriptional regulator [Chloracidobacterium sp. 2]QUV88557.1 Crp/Fnr family transcriptional regulator [Chloracidobacterium sp. S]QUV91479.1 Crp/Fnr family transcriptional regulator [Chloracidobacterium sp. A]QUV94655.1 Crp/Fnr family transcriptional regulator [Chloracidobacterium sp. N]QUV97859.1 Crp/Fnr family transcriptional regulator [Chloracidobacterium sp. E]
MSTIDPIAEFIQGQLNEIRVVSGEREYHRNETIYHLDDPADHIFYILSGSVKITRVSDDGKEKIISIHRAGEIFGELCFCEVDDRRSDQAVAMEPTRVLAIRVHDFLAMLRENPKALLDMLSLFCKRLSEAQQQIETLAFDNTTRRLARVLLKSSSDSGLERLRLTHEELAQMVGTSREIITTIMNQFREEGLIDYRRSEVSPHVEKLRQFLVTA